MTAVLSSLPPKLIRLTADAPPQEIKPEVGDLAARVSMVKSRLGKSTFTSQSDKERVPMLYEDYVKSIVGVLQTTLSLAGAEDPQLVLPAMPSVSAPAAAPLRLADGQLLLQLVRQHQPGSVNAGGEDALQLGTVQGGRLQLLLAGGDAEVQLDSCSQIVLPWRPPAEDWAAAFQLEMNKLSGLNKRVQSLNEEMRHVTSTKDMSDARMQDFLVKVHALVPAFEGELKAEVERFIGMKALLQVVGGIGSFIKSNEVAKAAAEKAAEAAKAADVAKAAEAMAANVTVSKEDEDARNAETEEAVNQAAEEQTKSKDNLKETEKALEGQRQELSDLIIETSRRTVKVPAFALRKTGAAGERRYASGQWITVRQPNGRWADTQVSTDCAPMRSDGQELPLHPWNHAPRELLQADFEELQQWWKQTLRTQHSHIADALTGKQLDVLQQCVALNIGFSLESFCAAATGTRHTLLKDKDLLAQLFVCADVNHDSSCSAKELADLAAAVNELAGQLNGHNQPPEAGSEVGGKRGVGRFDLTSFLAVASKMHTHPILRDKELLAKLFKSADVNHDGVCSATELVDLTDTLDELASLTDGGIQDACGLSQWLLNSHTDRCKGGQVDTPAAALLIGPPAAGKTCLMSQVGAAQV